MRRTTNIIALATGLALACASHAAAQSGDSKAYVDLNLAGQTQSSTIATSSVSSLFNEPATISTSQTVGKGLAVDGGVGYRVWNDLAIGVALSVFTRSPIGTASVTVPDPLVYGVFNTVSASPALNHREVGTHVKIGFRRHINNKIDVGISVGPSFVRLSKDIVSATLAGGSPTVTVSRQTGTGVGVNGGADLGYFFTPWLGGGLFARYVRAEVDLPAVSGVTVGGFQGGLGLRFRF
jgi:hypothetical protein